ncbi:hypothetical protein M0805_008319 [Coniferiporia weirii]|nr:hypothetical protein M0805_008319 [Coniferiporia weirii]
MHISFFPSLGSRTGVPICATNSIKSDTARATFTARLSPFDYEEAFNSGVRIELWTNVPGNGWRDGDWGAIAFEEVHAAAEVHLETNGSLETPELRISGEDTLSPPAAGITGVHVFRAALSLPRTSGKTFAFTYRLVYPSGICWLGSDRNNGVIEPVPGSDVFEENGEWERHEKERVFLLEQERDVEEDIGVGWLDVASWKWSGWALDGSSVWPISDFLQDANRKARLIYLVPSPIEETILVPRAQLFRSTSWLSPISISPQGKVILHFSEEGTVERRAHNVDSANNLRLLQSEIISSCPAPEVFKLKDNFNTIFFSQNNDSDTPSTIYAQPLTIPARRSAFVPQKFLDVFTKDSPVISLYSRETQDALFIDRSQPAHGILLRLGRAGGNFDISPAYALGDDSSSKMQVSLTSHGVRPEGSRASEEVKNPLPTPPSSPTHKPRHTVSFSLPSEDAVEQARLRRHVQQTSTSTYSEKEDASRLRGPFSVLQRVQAVAGDEQVKAFVLNLLKLIARMLGIAVLRLFMFAFRSLGATRPQGSSEEEVVPINTTSGSAQKGTTERQGEASADVDSDLGSGTRPESEVAVAIAAPRPTESSHSVSGPPSSSHHSGANVARSGSGIRVLKWILPADGAPAVLVVRPLGSVAEKTGFPGTGVSTAEVDIELDGKRVELSTVVRSAVGGTSVYEIARPGGMSSVLEVMPRTQG